MITKISLVNIHHRIDTSFFIFFFSWGLLRFTLLVTFKIYSELSSNYALEMGHKGSKSQREECLSRHSCKCWSQNHLGPQTSSEAPPHPHWYCSLCVSPLLKIHDHHTKSKTIESVPCLSLSRDLILFLQLVCKFLPDFCKNELVMELSSCVGSFQMSAPLMRGLLLLHHTSHRPPWANHDDYIIIIMDIMWPGDNIYGRAHFSDVVTFSFLCIFEPSPQS